MKYIKALNEFNRTIGFRYSEPNIGYKATILSQGSLSKRDLLRLADYLEVKIQKVKITSEEGKVKVEDEEFLTDTKIEFDFYVYSEAEIEQIGSDIKQGLSREFGAQVYDFLVSELPKLKKRNEISKKV